MPESARVRTMVPEFGAVVLRERLLRVFDRTRPSATLVVAPAAYGKSVLASQIAGRHKGRALWLHLPPSCATSSEILMHALLALAGGQTHRPSAEYVPVSPPPSMLELLGTFEELVGDTAPDTGCIVFDNLCSDASAAACELATAVLQRGTGVAYVFTVRAASSLPDRPIGAWHVGSRDLLLDDQEIEDIVGSALGETPSSELIEHLVRSTGRQPGLLSVAARCLASEPRNWRAVALSRHDLSEALWHMAASQLDDTRQSLLRCMALLGTGTLGELSRVLGQEVNPDDVALIGAAIPLVNLEGRSSGSRFRVHELAQDAFGAPAGFVRSDRNAFVEILGTLEARGEEERLLSLASASECAGLLATWLERVGFRVLRQGGLSVLKDALSGISPVQMVEHPRLLVLKAAQELESGNMEAAYRDSRVARELAEQESDGSTLANAMLVLAQSTAGLCDFVLARTYFDRAIALCGESVDSGTLTHLYGRRLAMDALFGDVARYTEARRTLIEISRRDGRHLDSTAFLARFFAATGDIILCGAWTESARALESAYKSETLNLGLRVAAVYNFFGCMLETGRIDEAESVLSKYVEMAMGAGNEGWAAAPLSLRAGISCARGTAEGVLDQVRRTAEREWESGERLSATTELITCACGLLGNREYSDALKLAELAVRWADEVSGPLLVWPARLEEACARLALGEEAAAAGVAELAAQELEAAPARHIKLKATLIMAEVDRHCGRAGLAVERIREHRDYILTESANWQLAMYVRAFPGLLGPLTAAVGASQLPVHMLQMVLPQYAEEAVAAAIDVLPPAELDILSQRLLGRRTTGRRSTDREASTVCRVRLFGGLHVEVAGRVIEDSEWRKRKARLLFAMLASRCGKDVPRDQLLEYLWPEMDEAQALNNLYVVWSSMKRVLTPGAKRVDKCCYVEHRGGVCRAVQAHVQTDLDEFDELLITAAKARAEGNEPEESAALRRVAEIYRGELLPGEAYDDWFAGLRERCRHDFEDAMLRAAALMEAHGDVQGGLGLLRRALQHDPWREDLYQTALRLQILSGQRSAAIETYLTCRSRLVDDLGIDPSAETTRLYQQVLGMEERPFRVAPPKLDE